MSYYIKISTKQFQKSKIGEEGTLMHIFYALFACLRALQLFLLLTLKGKNVSKYRAYCLKVWYSVFMISSDQSIIAYHYRKLQLLTSWAPPETKLGLSHGAVLPSDDFNRRYLLGIILDGCWLSGRKNHVGRDYFANGFQQSIRYHYTFYRDSRHSVWKVLKCIIGIVTPLMYEINRSSRCKRRLFLFLFKHYV